ncbi:BREX system P-loop protein BrxC [Methylotenera sp.]|uniref:BREX system P-loop protein BrxC n=1 Tax=Methylotenera sp. TaxID=2051956 RepID=UPI00273351FE|nr:BREX system P-loop protein BrxC [Methylotenera sp.]MDP3308446.1 BREX system P-loop protein BrxC [Methylotenera sp.]
MLKHKQVDLKVLNLATLCVDQIDTDKLALKRKVQESLARLENQRLVSRNGDLWCFLTNEERDVAREIGHVEVSASEKSRLLCELLFDDILDQQAKVRHRDTKADYEINRLLDGAPWKNANHELTLEILSPLGDDYERLNDAQCILRSSGKALIRLSEGNRFDIELSHYLQIEKYIDSPKASNASASLKTILINRKDENRERRTRLRDQLSTLMVTGDCYALGQKQQFKVATPSSLLDELVNYLISNTYTKLPYLKHRQADAIAEIRAVLNADDIGQHSLALGGDVGNPLALKEMRDFLQLKATTERVLLSDVVDRFTGMPWGWKPEWEVVLLIARLFMAGEIKLMLEGSDVDPKSAIDPLTKSVKFKQVSILKRKTADAVTITKARDLHKELFSKLAKEDEDGLVADFHAHLKGWQSELNSCAQVASTKYYPGKTIIDQSLVKINKQLAIRDTFEFIEALLAVKNDWLDAAEYIHDVISFYKTQIDTWVRMLDAMREFADNQDALLKDAQSATALRELEAIRDNVSPYGQVNRIDALIGTVAGVNNLIAGDERESALLSIDQRISEVQKALADTHADASLSNKVLQPMQQLKATVAALSSIPKIRYLKDQAGNLLDSAMDAIAFATKPAALIVSEPGSVATALTTGATKPVVPAKPTKVVRAADVALQSYLETESDVDEYLARLKKKIVAEINAGGKVRVQ